MQRLPQLQEKQQLPENLIPQPPEEPMPQPPQPPKQPRKQPMTQPPQPPQQTGAGAAARTRAQLAPSSNKINKQAQCPHYRPMPRQGKIPQPPQPPKQQQHTLRASALAAGAGPALPPLRALTLAASAGPAARGANSGPETPQLPSSNKINLNKQASGALVRRMRAGPGPGQRPGAARHQLQRSSKQRSKQAQCPPYRQRRDTLDSGE
jgi:hypothetical protein